MASARAVGGHNVRTCRREEQWEKRDYASDGREGECPEERLVLRGEQAAKTSTLKWACVEFANPNLRGTSTRRMAFSCTCQPNMYDVKPQRVNAVTKDLYDVFVHSLPMYI